MNDNEIQLCAELIHQADGLLITAGAGMGVDSGLPDFRGQEGFWQAYPALRQAGIEFSSIANPEAFDHDPRLAWGFYGHRLKLYRETQPHTGFAMLRDFALFMEHGVFVYLAHASWAKSSGWHSPMTRQAFGRRRCRTWGADRKKRRWNEAGTWHFPER